MIVGHSKQREALLELVRTGRIPHAVLMTGMAGVGKKLVAEEIAGALLCERNNGREQGALPCGHCRSCTVFRAGNHPDFHLIEAGDRAVWNTENIKDLLFGLHLSPLSGGNRVVLINDADRMPLQAANALLKILEEPRPKLFFLLIAANRSRLPDTILSRCQCWFFDRLADHEILAVIARWMEAETPFSAALRESGVAVEELAAVADGSLESLEHLGSDIEDWRKVCQLANDVADGRLVPTPTLSKEFSADKNRLHRRLHALRVYSRQRMVKSRDNRERRRWGHCLESTLAAERLISDRNLNASYVIEQILIDLAAPVIEPLSLRHPPSIESIIE